MSPKKKNRKFILLASAAMSLAIRNQVCVSAVIPGTAFTEHFTD